MSRTDWSEAKRRRVEIAQRPRRTIFNPAQAILTVEFDDPSWKEALLIRLNGEELTDGRFVSVSEGQTDYELVYNVRVPPLRTGRNVVELAARNDVVLPKSIVTIRGLNLTLEYA